MSHLTELVAWVKAHAAALLAATVILQNQHFLGAKFDGVLTVIRGLFSTLGGT